MEEQLTFQLTGGVSIPTSPLQSYFIEKIEYKTAKQFVEFWHYSRRMPTGKNICYGLKNNRKLYAVIVYGIGVNPYQSQFLGVKKCVEIKRMCRTEPKQNYPLSRLISISTKFLKIEMDFDAIVAFADPEHEHKGIVYKAAGYSYMGMTNSEYHLCDTDGKIRHRRFAFRHARRNNITVAESRDKLKVKRIKTLPKHRWVKIINEPKR